MNFNFEWINLKTIGKTHVTIAGYGINFPKDVVDLMGKPQYIKIGIAERDKVLGIMPCGEDEQNKIEFASKIVRNSYVRLCSKGLIRQIKNIVKINKSSKFQSKWDKENNILLIYLTHSIKEDKELNK